MGCSLDQYRATIGLFRQSKVLLKIVVEHWVYDHIGASLSFFTLVFLLLWYNIFLSVRHAAMVLFNFFFCSVDVHANPGPQNLKKLKICHANVRSLKTDGKLDEVRFLADTENMDIITLSETWLDESFPDQLLTVSGFQPPLRSDRNSHGGGVAIYVKDSIPCTRRLDLESVHCEFTWAEISTNRGLAFVGVYYRPPGQSASERDVFFQDF